MPYSSAHFYNTVEDVLLALDNGTVTGTLAPPVDNETPYLWELNERVAAAITGYIETSCVPYFGSYQVRREKLYNTTVLKLPDPVISLINVINNGDDVIGDVNTLAQSTLPSIFIEYPAGWSLPEPSSYVQVNGIFGWYTRSGDQWRRVQDSFTINGTATIVALTNASTVGRGDLLRAGEEYMLVLAKSGAGNNTLELKRAANGSVAAAHNAVDLSAWQVEPRVRGIATEMATWFYKNRHRSNELFQTPGGTVKVDGLSDSIWEELDALAPRTRQQRPYG